MNGIETINHVLTKFRAFDFEIEADRPDYCAIRFRLYGKKNIFRLNPNVGLVEQCDGGMLCTNEMTYKIAKKLGYK